MNFWFDPPDLPSDFDGNYYHTVDIGSQTWMVENLLVTHFRDGTNIPNVIEQTLWNGLSTDAYCWWNNNFTTYKNTYGALYNWYAVVKINKLCPEGWHVPTDTEFKTLEMSLGMTQAQANAEYWRGSTQGTQLKSTTGWTTGNGTNTSGFTALPGGYRWDQFYTGIAGTINVQGLWWSSTKYPDPIYNWWRGLGNSNSGVYRGGMDDNAGLSVRCVKNMTPALATTSITSITPNTAQSGGYDLDYRGSPVTEKGICWNTSGSPTIDDIHTNDGGGSNLYPSYLNNLIPNTTYHVRAYAINSEGENYGNEIDFITPCPVIGITTVQANVKCFGGSTGTVTAYPGGTGPWVYSWSTAPEQTTATASNLTAGTYTVNVIDANGCPGSKDVTITQPAAPLTVSTTHTNVLCRGYSTGNASANGVGGTSPYTYNWNTEPVQLTATASNLSAGEYTVTVTDANGCTALRTISITQPATNLTVTTSKVDVLCFGNSTGSATAIVSGGTGPYASYSWSTNPAQTTPMATNLAAGTYTVMVTDANGCTSSATVTIIQPLGLEVVGNVVHQTCNNCNNAAINLSVNGGTPGFSYAWTGLDGYSAISQNITSLKPGSYRVVVTDAHGCSKTAYAEVINPFIVTTTSDDDVIGTLRYAINYSNNKINATPDLITFNIPGSGPFSIQPGP